MAIELTLFEIGKETYDKVVKILYERYQSYIPDCYEHPQYLSEILKELFGNAHNAVVERIGEQLEEFSYNEPIAKFLKVISQ